jgi:branched-chain amino acid transport system substrate-binding protein
VRARRTSIVLIFFICSAAVAVSGISGCGAVGVSTASLSDQLTVYSSLPLQGPAGGIARQISNGEKLALYQVGGHVGPFKVSLYALDDVNSRTGEWEAGITATNAKTAAQDTTAIAYLGDYDSGASAVSLPLVNAAGILQVSPGSPYVGLTSSLDAGQDEPERFYPTGQRTFARLMPSDAVQAAAAARLLGELGVGRVYVIDDQDPLRAPLAEILAEGARSAGIAVVGRESIGTTSGTAFGEEVERVQKSGAGAVFFSGAPDVGAVALWRELHAADPGLWLIGSSALAEGGFAAREGGFAAGEGTFAAAIGGAGARTRLMSPVLPMGMYPASAQRLARTYERTFGEAAEPWALYGYGAMSAVLDSIRASGARGGDRATVIAQFFRIHGRDSVLGRYSVAPSGDTTLSRYGVDRVVRGRSVFYRAIETG